MIVAIRTIRSDFDSFTSDVGAVGLLESVGITLKGREVYGSNEFRKQWYPSKNCCSLRALYRRFSSTAPFYQVEGIGRETDS